MNDSFVLRQAERLASRVQGTASVEERVREIYRLTVGREPTRDEEAAAAALAANSSAAKEVHRMGTFLL